MDRRRFLVASLAGALGRPLAARAQQTRKVYRVGVLDVVDVAANADNLGAFRQGLSDLGYVAGRDVVIEYRSADGLTERLPDLAGELVQLKVDVLVTRGTPAALAAQHASRTIPVVMASSGDPAAEGVVASLARPGGNVTGLHLMAPAQFGGRRLKLLKEIVPGLSRVAVLSDPANHYGPVLIRDMARVAATMGIRLQRFDVPSPDGLERAFEAAALVRLDGLITVEDSLMFGQRARIVDFAAMGRLPALYGLREFVDAGGLASYGTDRRDLFRRAATYVHRIFRGASPADLPIEGPTRFELVVNRKTAKTLGLSIAPSLLTRADRVLD
jgi:putative ABC transport system substrate-binding protein